MKTWEHADKAPLKGHPAVGTVYADGGYEFELGIIPDLPDIHGYVCPHGVACPEISVREKYCGQCLN